MTKEQAKKVFPFYMRNVKIPDGAKEEECQVYRICKSGRVDKESFLTSYIEYKQNGNLEYLDLKDVSTYSISCWEKKRDAKRSLALFTRRSPNAIASKGVTAIECGVIQKTGERGGKNKKSHIDWWVYKDSTPHIYFREVDLNDE